MKPKNKKLVLGVGVNDADYVVVKHETTEVDGVRKRRAVWRCPYYLAWTNMLKRCYSTKQHDIRPNYKGCSVSEDWLTFSSFRAWMVTQNWEGLQLDKDLLIKGNKIYSADTCVFVTQLVNKFTSDRGNARGEWLIGLYWHTAAKKFKSQCNNPFTKKIEHLGYFTCEQQAHQAWAKRKLELAHLLAAEQTDPRVAKALIDRYSYD